MHIKRKSFFKDPVQDIDWLEKWVSKLETLNSRSYERIQVQTALGKTHIWGLNTPNANLETLVIFPGARTSSLFWDFDRGLDHLGQELRIFLVETNGLPNFSDGASPDIKSLDYGWWAVQVLNELGLEKTFVAGASFGGLICMKLGIVAPEKINAAFLLNPGCLQGFSMTIKNLYYNLLPIIRPSEKHVLYFLNKAVFSKPNHQLSPEAEKLLVDYELFAIRRYRDKTQKPYYMNRQLSKVAVMTYLLEGNKDILFPYIKSIKNAQRHIRSLNQIKVFSDVGHGIETYPMALAYIGQTISRYGE